MGLESSGTEWSVPLFARRTALSTGRSLFQEASRPGFHEGPHPDGWGLNYLRKNFLTAPFGHGSEGGGGERDNVENCARKHQAGRAPKCGLEISGVDKERTN